MYCVGVAGLSTMLSVCELQVEDAMITPLSPDLYVHSPKPFTELGYYTVAFKLENGSVVEIYPNYGETEQILNIKRGIISMFQIYLTGNDGTQIVEEVSCSWYVM